MKTSNPERQHKLIELFDRAPLKKTFGMDFTYNEAGSAVFVMPYNPAFDHAMNSIHGGVFATLLDNAGWFTVASYYDRWISTVEMQVRLLEHVAGKTLVATGTLVKAGNRIAVATMEIRTEDGVLAATGSGTFTVTGLAYDA